MLIDRKLFYVTLVFSTFGGILFSVYNNKQPITEISPEAATSDWREERPATINKGSIERLTFQNINNQVFLLETFRDVQSGELYILAEAEKHIDSQMSQMNCVLCKNKYSFYDDPDECIELKVKSVHKRTKAVASSMRATFFYCVTTPQLDVKNYSLSTLKIGREYGHLVPISDINRKKDQNYTLITMCGGPHFGKHKKAVNLAEWIEFNRLMGVDKFQIYVTDNNSVSKEYHEMLKKYVEKGIVDLIYWEGLSKSHYYTQFTLINHCVWRNKAKSKLVAYNDIDEFFVPANNSYNNWHEAFSSYLENTNNSEICFRNWFYDASCPDNSSDLLLSSVFIREKEPWLPNRKTKCILYPERILLAGIHKSDEFMPEHKKNHYKSVVIPPEEGYMAHLREGKVKTPECDPKKAENVEINKKLAKYGKMIEGEVNKMKKLIEKNNDEI